jgi:AcrR family transcriptional regulator
LSTINPALSNQKMATRSNTSSAPRAQSAPSSRPHRRAKGQGGLTRSDILAAATDLLEQMGRKGTTIRAIAERVGISSTALYFHFDDLDSILFEICDATYAGLSERFDRDASRHANPVQRVVAMMRSYVDFGLLHPQAYALSFIEPKKGHLHAEAEGKTPQSEQALSRFAQAVAQARQAAGNSGLDAGSITHLLWFASHGLVTMAIARPEVLPHKASTMAKSLAALLAKGAFGIDPDALKSPTSKKRSE